MIAISNDNTLRRLQRVIRNPAILSDYVTYMTEDMDEYALDDDPKSFKEAVHSEHASEWLSAMQEEMKSMSTNKVWDLVEIPLRS